MDYEKSRVWQLLEQLPWKTEAVIRIFWLRYSGKRDEFAASLAKVSGSDAVLAFVVRKHSFYAANAVLSDVLDLLVDHRPTVEAIGGAGVERLTVLLIARDEFQLVQAASEITLPEWFPICAGLERSFVITDLGQTAEASPLNCTEARIGSVSELLFNLEAALVSKLKEIRRSDSARVVKFLQTIQPGAQPPIADPDPTLTLCEKHLGTIADRAAYRPSADGKYLCGRMIKLTLNSTPKQLGEIAAVLAACMPNSEGPDLRPSFFAIAWRPAAKMTPGQANWHAVFVGMFQAYQLMNGSAHAGEYPTYPVSLQYAMSLDLRGFLIQARAFVDAQA